MEIKGVEEERQHPWLVISQKEKQFFYSVSNDRFHSKNIAELRNKYVFGYAFGWLVLVDIETDDCCLWHPVSSDKIELPELALPLEFNKCFLSKPPIEPDCHIVFLASDNNSQNICRIGDDQFVKQTSTYNGESLCLSALVNFQGKIYGVAVTDYQYWFVIVDFVGGILQVEQILKGGQPWYMPHPSRSWASVFVDYLIESSHGELLLVHKMFSYGHMQDCLDFRVILLDVDRKNHKELHNIGNQAIFVNDFGDAICCSISLGIEPNSIYYTIPGSRDLFIFNLDDRSTTRSMPCPIAQRSKSESYWIPPKIFPNFLVSLS